MKAKFVMVVFSCLLAEFTHAQARPDVPPNCDGKSANGDCDLFRVSMVQLLTQPEEYDGKRVRTFGYIHFEFEGNGIYLHKEDFDYRLISNRLWVDLTSGFTSDECQDSYVLVEGIFDVHSRGHMGGSMGAISDINRCERWP